MNTAQQAKRMRDIPFSDIRRIFERVNQMQQAGQAVIRLDVGRPDFDTPAHIKQATAQALMDGHVHYTSNYGIPELREAIAHKLREENEVRVDASDEVIVTAGVSEAIMITMQALLNPGDEVLLMAPLFPAYAAAVRMAGAIPIIVETHAEQGYSPNRETLERAITPRTRMLVITTPGNPTGAVLAPAALQEIAEFTIRHDLLVVSDEIYEKLIYDGLTHVSIASLPGMHARTLTLNGFSKSHAMTGWRLGYVAGPRTLLDALIRVHQNTVVCATAFAQHGALAALTGTQAPMQAMVRELDARRTLVLSGLSKIPGLRVFRPQGAMYCFCDVAELTQQGATRDAHALARDLLESAHVSVVPWDRKHIRLSLGTGQTQLSEAMHRLQEYLEDQILPLETIQDTHRQRRVSGVG